MSSLEERREARRRRRMEELGALARAYDTEDHDAGDMFSSLGSPSASNREARTSPVHQASENKSNVEDDDDLERKRRERREARQAREREGASGGDEEPSRRSRRNQEESSEDTSSYRSRRRRAEESEAETPSLEPAVEQEQEDTSPQPDEDNKEDTPVAEDTSADDAAEAERQEENRRRQKEQAEEEDRSRRAREEEEEKEERRKQEENRRRQREEDDRKREEQAEEQRKEEGFAASEQSKAGEGQHRQWERDKPFSNGDHRSRSEHLIDNTKFESRKASNSINSSEDNHENEWEKRRAERRKKWEEDERLAKEAKAKEDDEREQRREERRQRWVNDSRETKTNVENTNDASDLKKQYVKLSEQKQKSLDSESSLSSNKQSPKPDSHSALTATSNKSTGHSVNKNRFAAINKPTHVSESRIEQKRSSYDKPWLTKSPTGRSHEDLADPTKLDESWKKRASGISINQRKEKFSENTHKQSEIVPKKMHLDQAKSWNTRGDPQKPFGERRKMFEFSTIGSASQKSEHNNSHVKNIDSSLNKNHSLGIEKYAGLTPEEIAAEEMAKTLDVGRLEMFKEMEKQQRLEQRKGLLRNVDHDRIEKDRLESEKQSLENERLRGEQIERERLAQEKLENERIKNERIEQEQIENEQLEHHRIENERLEWERIEKERLEYEQIENRRLELEQIENERLEKEWIEQKCGELERVEAELLEQKQLAEAQEEKERARRLEMEQLEHERLGMDRSEIDWQVVPVDKRRGQEEQTHENLSSDDLSHVHSDSGDKKFRKDDDWRRKSVERQSSVEAAYLHLSHSRLDPGSKPSAGQVGLRKARFESESSMESDDPVTKEAEKRTLPKRDNLRSSDHDENRNKVSLLSKWKTIEAQSQSESTSHPARITASQSKPLHIGKLKQPIPSPGQKVKNTKDIVSLVGRDEPKANVQSRWTHEKSEQVTETRTTLKVPASKQEKTVTKIQSSAGQSDGTVKKWILKMETPSTKPDKTKTTSHHAMDSDLRLGRNIQDVSKTVGLFEEQKEKAERSSTPPTRYKDSNSVTVTSKHWGSSKELPDSTTNQAYSEKYSLGENNNNNSPRKWSSQHSLSTQNEFEQSSENDFHKDTPVILKCGEILSQNNTPSQHDYEADTESLNYEASTGQGDRVAYIAADDYDHRNAAFGSDPNLYTGIKITTRDRRLQRSRVEDFGKDWLDPKTGGHFREEITANINFSLEDERLQHMSTKAGVKTMLIIDPRNRGGPLEDGEEIVIVDDHTTNIKFQPADYSTDDADSIEPDVSTSAQSDDLTSARRDSLSDCSLDDYNNRTKYVSSDVLIGAEGYSGTDTLSSGIESNQNYRRLQEENDLLDQTSTTRWQYKKWEEREEQERLEREKRKAVARQEEDKKKKKGKRKGLGGLSPEKKKFLKDEVDSGAFEASTDDNDDEDEQDKEREDSYIKERDVQLRSRLEPLPGDLDKMGQDQAKPMFDKLPLQMIMQKAAEDLRNEAKLKAEEKEQYIISHIEMLPDLEGMSESDLQKLCKNLHQKMSNLEEEVYDWEVKIRKQTYDINEITLKVNDMKGKFVKPVLKKVSKTDAKLAKIGMKDAKDFRSNLKSTGQSKFALDDDKEVPKTPDWRENLKTEEKDEQQAETDPEPAAEEVEAES